MNITKKQFEAAIQKAYTIGYDDSANAAGYCIAIQQKLADPRVHKRPKDTNKKKLLEKVLEELKSK